MLTHIVEKRLTQALLLVGCLTTFLINPWGNYDPINPIKVLTLSTIAFFTFGLLTSKLEVFTSLLPRIFLFSIIFFVTWMFIVLFVSQAPKTQQIWGMFGRNTGIVMYLSLVLIQIASSCLRKEENFHTLLKGFLLMGLIETFYSYLQLSKMDPIKWNIQDIFGTLGNANFLSAFLGMTAIASLALSLKKNVIFKRRSLLFIFLILQLIILKSTSSIQGLMIFLGSSVVVLYIYLKFLPKFKKLKLPYLIMSIILLIFTSLALFNIGPLRKLVYQDTIIFRTDYWHAGFKMTIANPIFGVGIDSYGDWYRTFRGFISATRTDPNRTANTAHNIFLDISSGGGIPLIIAYLAMLSIAIALSLKYLKSSRNYDPVFTSFFASWIGYQLQSFISINQVGVGVWGWILTGLLVGYCRMKLDSTKSSASVTSGALQDPKKNDRTSRKRTPKQQLLNPGVAVIGFAFMVGGFLLSLPPMVADLKFRAAMNKGDLNSMISASQSIGATAWHITQVVEVASKSNYLPQAIQMDQELIKRFPRDFYGWRVAASLNGIPSDLQAKARIKILELDPDNPNLDEFKK